MDTGKDRGYVVNFIDYRTVSVSFLKSFKGDGNTNWDRQVRVKHVYLHKQP